MSKRLYARGSDGVVCIVEGGSDDYINNPQYNLDKVHFHSALNYMRIPTIYYGSVSFPYRQAVVRSDSEKGKEYSWFEPQYGEVLYHLASHNLGYKPGVIAVDSTDALSGNYPVQQAGLSLRNASIVMDEWNIYLLEKFVTYQYDISAQTRSYTIYVFQDPI